MFSSSGMSAKIWDLGSRVTAYAADKWGAWMRAFFSAGLFLLVSGHLASAYGADARIAVTICNDRWNPPCRDFPVTTAVPVSPQIAEAGQRYSFQMKNLNQEQLNKLLSLLGVDQSKINLEAQ
jgi:hypothetical protein